MCFKKKNIQSKWNFTLLSWIAEYVFQSIAEHKSLILIVVKDTKLLVLLIFFLWVRFWTESEHTEPPYSPHLAVWFFHYPFHLQPEAQAYVETEAPVDLEGDFGGLCDWKEREKRRKKGQRDVVCCFSYSEESREKCRSYGQLTVKGDPLVELSEQKSRQNRMPCADTEHDKDLAQTMGTWWLERQNYGLIGRGEFVW